MLLTCERCKNKVEGVEYSEGSWGTVEEHYECPHCGLRRHWAYGHYMPEDTYFAEAEVTEQNIIEHMEANNVPKEEQIIILSRKSKRIEYVETKMLAF